MSSLTRLDKFDTVLVVDDEPLLAGWVFDFIAAKKFKSESSTSVRDAVEKLNRANYGVILVDLHLPLGEENEFTVKGEESQVYKDFPGMMVAKTALFLSTPGDRIIIYSVFQTEAIAKEIFQLRCACINKGRAEQMKDALKNLLIDSPRKRKAPTT